MTLTSKALTAKFLPLFAVVMDCVMFKIHNYHKMKLIH